MHFVSPAGHWVAYFDGQLLRKVSILGGPPLDICELPDGFPRGGSWGPDDTITFATSGASGLWRVPAGGGEPEQLTTPDPDGGDHVWPEILPGGEAVLFTIFGGTVESAQIAVLSLTTGESKILIPGGSHPRYAPTGHIVYGVGGTLRAVGFDPERLEVTSDPVPVLDAVITKADGSADFDVSQNGSLVYLSGDWYLQDNRTLLWIDRQGREELLNVPPGPYARVRVSPDGRHAVLDHRSGGRDVWTLDLERNTLSKLTTDPAMDNYPLWTPDGEHVVFASRRDESKLGFFMKVADGTGSVERLALSQGAGSRYFAPYSWSADKKTLIFVEDRTEDAGETETGVDINVLAMEGERPVSPLIRTAADEGAPAISPGGEWIAYHSNESGRMEVYVQRFPELGNRFRISTDGGVTPLWSPRGEELFYRSGERMMVVAVQTKPVFVAGAPQVLFEGQYYSEGFTATRSYDLSADGQRFLMLKVAETSPEETSIPVELIVVQNWTEELKRLVPDN